jgi:tetratricopeptide (TPR) repeat protein
VAEPEDSLDIADARPGAEAVAHAVTRARAASALFGVSAAVTVGRYRVLARLGAGGGGEVWSAFDPELGRRVALKMIDTAASRALRDHVKAEGQALARLAHPHVVPVHDVLEHGDHVVLVMELVDGQTLRAWASAPGRTARDVVRAYREVGEGLAAMHAAGLVHRDVKPDNAMVGTDGRVRVVDLGLAVAAPEGEGDDAGKVVGTPRYMAPEQAAGKPATAAADQYGLCASLREALGGGDRAVPPWLVPVLDRGMAEDPHARFPSVRALLAALAADPARRRRRIVTGAVAVAAAGAAVAAAFVVGRSEGARTSAAAAACSGGGPAVAKAWNQARRADANARLGAAATAYSAAAVPALVARFDDYATRWSGGFDAACRARAAGDASPTLAERRATCLATALTALDAVAALAANGTAADLPDLAQASASLPALERCDDDAALLADLAPPPPAIAAPAAALEAQLAVAQVHVDAARADATTLTAQAVDAARALAHPPLLARALVLDGRAQRDTADHGAARFTEAVDVALAAHDDATAVEAFARLVWAASISGGDRAVPDGVALVEKLAARQPGGAFARALLANNLGVAALARGDRTAARAAFTGALHLTADVDGPGAVELLVVRANLALVSDDEAERARILGELLALRTEVLGPAHPRTLDTRIMQGMLTGDLDVAGPALEGACADLARYHPQSGSDLAECWFELFMVQRMRDKPSEGLAALERVVATESSGGDPQRVAIARGYVALHADRLAEAEAAFSAVIAAVADPGDRWWIGIQRGEALVGRGRTRQAASRLEAARADASAALAELAPIGERQQLAWITRRVRWARAAVTWLRNPPGSPR